MFVWIKLLHQSNLRKMLKHFGDFAPKQDFKKLFFFTWTFYLYHHLYCC